MKALSLAVALTTMSFALGCGEDAPPPPAAPRTFSIEASVQNDNEDPMPNVAITLDGNIVGRTDADGKFHGTLTETPGTSITLGAIAPDGYRVIRGEEITEDLRTATLSGAVSGVPVYLATTIESLKKDYFVWVKTECGDHASECSGWPVLVDGKEVAKTNSLGYANFSFTREPYTDIEVMIQTPGAFLPKNPTYAVSLDASATVYRLGQEFKDPTRKKRVVRAPVRRPAKKKAEKKQSFDDILTPTRNRPIDLF